MRAGKKSYLIYCALGVFLLACRTAKPVTQNPAPVAPSASESFRIPDEEEQHGSSYMPKPDICEDEIIDTINKATSVPADSLSPHK